MFLSLKCINWLVSKKIWFDATQIFEKLVKLEKKRVIAKKGSFIYYKRRILRKTNISYTLIRARACAYQSVRNTNFAENFVKVRNVWSQRYLWKVIAFSLPMLNSVDSLLIVYIFISDKMRLLTWYMIFNSGVRQTSKINPLNASVALI